MDSNPYLSDILRHGVLLWFRNEHYDPEYVHPNFQLLVIEQNAIGWHHLFRGRLSKEWRRHQDIHLSTNEKSDPKKSGAQWSRSVVTHFLQRWLQLWKLRNNSRHGEDPETVAIALRIQVHRELAQLYSFRHEIMPRDKDLFYLTVAEHIEAHPGTTVIQNWLSTNRTLIVASAQEAVRRSLQGLHSIATYFHSPVRATIGPQTPLVPPSHGMPLATPSQAISVPPLPRVPSAPPATDGIG